MLFNIRQFLNFVKPFPVIAVVKANAYGHGLEAVVDILLSAPDFRARGWLAVDSITEAREAEALLGKRKIPILILGYTPEDELDQAVRYGFHQVVYDEAALKKLERLGARMKKPAFIHLKLETGTNRQGIKEEEIDSFLKLIKKMKWVRLVGVYSHFADAEDDAYYSTIQLETFNRLARQFEEAGVTGLTRHMASSAAILRYPSARLEAVRIGISLYGLYSIKDKKIKKRLPLKPALSWKTVVAQVKTIDVGETVGYGRTWRAKHKSRIAILPVGYADGYSRRFGNRARVLINGYFAPIIGRICMNMCMADISRMPKARAGDKVILIGQAGAKKITVLELAELDGTINYEIIARLNPLIPRIIV